MKEKTEEKRPRRDSGDGSLIAILNAKGRQTGRWIARQRYTDRDGRRREKKRICKSWEAAKEELQNLRAEIAAETRDAKTYAELDAFFRAEYLHAAKFVGGKKVSGFQQNLTGIRHYLDAALEHFGDMELAAITYADVYNYKRTIAERPARVTEANPAGRPRSVADTDHHLRWLRRLFNVAIEQGWLDASPLKRGRPLIVESHEVERTRVLSPDEERRLLAACSNEYRRHLLPIVIFAIDTAARRNEILATRWSDINHKTRSVQLRNKSQNTRSFRLAPVSARLQNVLADLWQNSVRQPFQPIFRITDFKRAWAGACKEAGLTDVHFHDLRHTAITRMLEDGIPIAEVMKISGHRQMKTFLRYVNQTETRIHEIATRRDQAA